jgi:outer membrane protein assembly factor BamC
MDPLALQSRSAVALAAAAALALGGCAAAENFLGGERIDYRSQASSKTAPLEVPPDLTQLTRDGRYKTQGGVVTASTVAAAASAPQAAADAPQVALRMLGPARIMRDGNQRWLLVQMPAEQLWPQLLAFWQERGFTLDVQNKEAGVIETAWAENRAKLPNDIIRRTVGRIFENLYSTAERDKFRTRIERTAQGTEVYITHRGLLETYTERDSNNTSWQPRPDDPQLEAEFLSRLMVKLGAPEEEARSAVAAAAPASAAAARPAVAPGATTLEVNDNFDRAWRRVGLALDRSGFTVEDRDRAGGLYYVRYVKPGSVGEEPGFFSRLFGASSKNQGPARYRVVVKSVGEKANVSVQNAQGAPEAGEAAQRIIAVLANELR